MRHRGERAGIGSGVVAAIGGAMLACAVLGGMRRPPTIELTSSKLTGVIGNDAGPSSRWEGSNAMFGMPSYSNDAMNAKEEETGFGVPGQLGTGPDYYSTANWDNAPLYPSLMNSKFDPYVGQGGCPSCKGPRKTYMFSVDPRCDGSYQCRNIRKILKLDQWSKEAAFQAAIYKEKTWIGNQAGFFIGESKDVVMVVPPCFFPPLANTELNALNDAIYGLGGSILVLGGLTGANFISQNMRGKDGHGYVDTSVIGAVRGSTYPEDSPKFTMDCVWSGGPFVMQNAAVNTEFFYGPRFLEGTESTWGIPVRELPPETIHYYMSADQISIVFEIPAGNGRIMFMGYDFGYMAPHWMEALMLARRELQIDAQYPAGSPVQFKQLPKPGSVRGLNLGHVGGGVKLLARKSERHASRGGGGRAERLPAGADGDEMDMEIAKAVDRLETKMKGKLEARLGKHVHNARRARKAKIDKKLPAGRAGTDDLAEPAGSAGTDTFGHGVTDHAATQDGRSRDVPGGDRDIRTQVRAGAPWSRKADLLKKLLTPHAVGGAARLPSAPSARGATAREWLATDAADLS